MSEILLVNDTASTLPFDEENQVLNITLPALKKTVTLESANGKLPESRPIEHFNMIETIAEMIYKHGFSPDIQNIYIKQQYSKRVQWPDKNIPCPLANYQINRCVGKIRIDRKEEEGALYGSTVAFSYSESGIEVALGPNVHDCSNYNIFGQYRITTFGSKRMIWRQLVELFEKWISKVPEFFDVVGDRISKLKSVQITDQLAEQYFGILFMNAVRQNYDTGYKAPLNQTQAAAAAREYLRNKGEIATAWDLCNAGTSALHIYRNDFSTVLGATEQFNDFTERFALQLIEKAA